jgi:hypothetical protein
MQSVNT